MIHTKCLQPIKKPVSQKACLRSYWPKPLKVMAWATQAKRRIPRTNKRKWTLSLFVIFAINSECQLKTSNWKKSLTTNRLKTQKRSNIYNNVATSSAVIYPKEPLTLKHQKHQNWMLSPASLKALVIVKFRPPWHLCELYHCCYAIKTSNNASFLFFVMKVEPLVWRACSGSWAFTHTKVKCTNLKIRIS